MAPVTVSCFKCMLTTVLISLTFELAMSSDGKIHSDAQHSRLKRDESPIPGNLLISSSHSPPSYFKTYQSRPYRKRRRLLEPYHSFSTYEPARINASNRDTTYSSTEEEVHTSGNLEKWSNHKSTHATTYDERSTHPQRFQTTIPHRNIEEKSHYLTRLRRSRTRTSSRLQRPSSMNHKVYTLTPGRQNKKNKHLMPPRTGDFEFLRYVPFSQVNTTVIDIIFNNGQSLNPLCGKNICLNSSLPTTIVTSSAIGESCKGLNYQKPLATNERYGYYMTEYICPSQEPCIVKLTFSIGRIQNKKVGIQAFPDQPLECVSILNVDEAGATITCRRPLEERTRCPMQAENSTTIMELQGEGHELFFILDTDQIFLRGDIKVNESRDANLAVWRTGGKNWSSQKTNVAVTGLIIPENTTSTQIEASRAFGVRGKPYSLACPDSHDKGRVINMARSDTLNGTLVPTSHRRLTFRKLELKHRGFYSCYYITKWNRQPGQSMVELRIVEPPVCKPVTRTFHCIHSPAYQNRLLREAPSAFKLFFEAMVRKASIEEPALGEFSLVVKRSPQSDNATGVDLIIQLYGEDCNESAITPVLQYFESIPKPLAFLNARKFLSGSFVNLDGQTPAMELSYENDTLNLECTFMSCAERRTYYLLEWSFDGAPVLGTPFRVYNETHYKRELLCTIETVSTVLEVYNFTDNYFGDYRCEMRIAYNHRVLPWTVAENRKVDQHLLGLESLKASKPHHMAFTTDQNDCINYTDDDTAGNSNKTMLCPPGYSGTVTRFCTEDGVWEPVSFSNCTRKSLEKVFKMVENMNSGNLGTTDVAVETVLERVSSSLSSMKPRLTGDLASIVTLMRNLSDVVSHSSQAQGSVLITQQAVEDLASITDVLLSAETDVWMALLEEEGVGNEDNGMGEGDDKRIRRMDSGASLLAAMDSLIVSSLMGSDIDSKPIVKENVMIKRECMNGVADIHFPRKEDAKFYQEHNKWVLENNSSAFLSGTAFGDRYTDVCHSVVLYKNLEDVLETQRNTSKQNALTNLKFGSGIMSFSLSIGNDDLLSDLHLRFSTHSTNSSSENFAPQCAYLETEVDSGLAWTSEHCRTEVSLEGFVHCYCQHLTNFVVLMRPIRDELHHHALSIISLVGCCISIVCLAITFITFIALWEYVKGSRTVLHMCLSASLLLTYLLLIVGIERTENKTGCFLITICLHYFLLVAFSVMIAEGVELYIRVKVVFARKPLGWRLLVPSFLVPFLIVAITLGCTWDGGYVSPHFCWLNMDSGALWSLVVPIIVVVVTNFVLVVGIFRSMFSTRAMANLEQKNKAKALAKAIFVISPLLGFTWILGLLAIHKDTVVFHYLFAVCNSLQGLFIFIFHCLLSKQIKDAIKLKIRIFRSRFSINSGTTTTGRNKTKASTRDEVVELDN